MKRLSLVFSVFLILASVTALAETKEVKLVFKDLNLKHNDPIPTCTLDDGAVVVSFGMGTNTNDKVPTYAHNSAYKESIHIFEGNDMIFTATGDYKLIYVGLGVPLYMFLLDENDNVFENGQYTSDGSYWQGNIPQSRIRLNSQQSGGAYSKVFTIRYTDGNIESNPTVDGQDIHGDYAIPEGGSVTITFKTSEDFKVYYRLTASNTAGQNTPRRVNEEFTEYTAPIMVSRASKFEYYTVNNGIESEITTVNFTDASGTTGLNEVEAIDSDKAEYYDITGRRVANPIHGFYIRVSDGKATKVLK